MKINSKYGTYIVNNFSSMVIYNNTGDYNRDAIIVEGNNIFLRRKFLLGSFDSHERAKEVLGMINPYESNFVIPND